MSQYLSLALGAREPMFSQSIQELERAGGRPSADIRLGADVSQRIRSKIAALGLDPHDTTGPELYNALLQRLSSDEAHVRTLLSIAPQVSSLQVLATLQKKLASKQIVGSCFALKATSARRLFKKKVPKATMKALGYRSLDSMLKHEPIAALYVAAAASESSAWQRAFYEQYAKLTNADFEQRPLAVVLPTSKRWEVLADRIVAVSRQHCIALNELGAVVLLPHSHAYDGQALTTMVLALHEMNAVRAYSSFIKLQQVTPDFGRVVARTARGEPMTSAYLAGQQVSWRVIQRYYGRLRQAVHPTVFEPHVQPEDLQWRSAETVLTELDPALAFWQDTDYICAVHDGQPISLNIIDVALSYCNRLHFTDRLVQYAREHLWHELMGRYLHQDNLEATVHQQLTRSLVSDQALA